jgi:hypothetical protein
VLEFLLASRSDVNIAIPTIGTIAQRMSRTIKNGSPVWVLSEVTAVTPISFRRS